MSRPLFLLIVASLAAVPALAQVVVPPLQDPPKGGVAARGAIIARRWCAECHVIAPDQQAARADAPSFAAIARKEHPAGELERFLMNPHPKMPDMQIGRAEAMDLVAYIAAQR